MLSQDRAPGAPAPVPPDPQAELIDRLSDDELLDAIESETYDLFDRIESKLAALEAKYLSKPAQGRAWWRAGRNP